MPWPPGPAHGILSLMKFPPFTFRRVLAAWLIAGAPVFAANLGRTTGISAAALHLPAVSAQQLATPAPGMPAVPAGLGSQAALPQLPAAAVPGVQAQADPSAPGAIHPGLSASQQILRAAAPSGPEGEAAAAGVFDGSMPAGAQEAFVVEGAADPEALFEAEHPGHQAKAVLARLGIPFTAFAQQTLLNTVFMQTRDGERELEHMLGPVPGRGKLLDLAGKILDLAEREDAPGRRFAAAVGADMARDDQKYADTHKGVVVLPENPLGAGEYWDLAAGPNAFGHMMSRLDPATRYVFLDRSAFVTSYLETARRLNGTLSNVRVLKADLRDLRKPARPLSVIRWKNVHTYVEGFEERLHDMAGWLAPGGRLVIQTDLGAGYRMALIKQLGPVFQTLMAEGWAFDHGPLGVGDLETLHFTRPAGPLSASALAEALASSQRGWRGYLREVARVNRSERATGGWGF